MAKGIKRKIKIAIDNIDKQISYHARDSLFASALASEGYNGGYRDALLDVSLLLNGQYPCRKRDFWHVLLPNQSLDLTAKK